MLKWGVLLPTESNVSAFLSAHHPVSLSGKVAGWLKTVWNIPKSLTLSAGCWKQVNVAKVRTVSDGLPVINGEKIEDLNPHGSRKGDCILKGFGFIARCWQGALGIAGEVVATTRDSTPTFWSNALWLPGGNHMWRPQLSDSPTVAWKFPFKRAYVNDLSVNNQNVGQGKL